MKKRLLAIWVLISVVLLLVPVAAVAISPLNWLDSQVINSDKWAEYPQVAFSGANAVAVWDQTDGVNNRIYSNYSTDFGVTWHDNQLIENNAGQDGYQAQVVLSGSVAVAVWRQSDGANFRIYSNYSTDAGKTWHSGAQAISAPGNEAESPRLAISGSNVITVWDQFGGTENRIYSNNSTDSGISWQGAQLIENNAGFFGYSAQVTLTGLNGVAIWRQWDGSADRVYTNYTSDGGASWHTDQTINAASTSGFDPQVAMSGSNVVAVWRWAVGMVNRIYSNYSTDSGANWHTAQLISDAGLDAYDPQVALVGLNAVAVWKQTDGSSDRIFRNYSADGGATWHTGQLIENNAGKNGSYPQVGLSGTLAVAVWSQSDGNDDRIWSNFSVDSGVTWNSAQLIEDNAGHAGNYPQVSLSGSNAVAVWEQYDDSTLRIYSNCFGHLVGSLQIQAFNDLNNNGVREAGNEPVLPDWSFNIVGPENFSASGVTDSSGLLTLSDLAPGTYTIYAQYPAPQNPGGAWYSTTESIKTVKVVVNSTTVVQFGDNYNPKVPASSSAGLLVLTGILGLLIGLTAFFRTKQRRA